MSRVAPVIKPRGVVALKPLVLAPAPIVGMGLDPGFANLGLAVVEFGPTSQRLLCNVNIETTGDDHGRRKREICDRLIQLTSVYRPSYFAYEAQGGVAAGKAGRGAPTSHAANRVHEVVGIIEMLACVMGRKPCYANAVSTAKVALLGKGHGRASKTEMVEAAKALFKLKQCNEHKADAIAQACAGFRRYVDALSKVQL